MKTIEINLNDPKELKERNIIVKGLLYQNSNTIILALETTCNYTKDSFKGVVVKNLHQCMPRTPYPIGFKSKWNSTNFKYYKNEE